MSHELRQEAASIARALRQAFEREAGSGDALASGIARARAKGIALPDLGGYDAAAAEAPPSPALAAPARAPVPARAAAAPAAFSPPLQEPAPMSRATATPRIPDDVVLPPFAQDLWPAAMAGARDAVHAAALPVLEQVATEARGCEKCGLCTTRTNAVPGVGSARSGIVFVGEAPGADEDARGEPFVGRAGELLTAMIKGMDERGLIPGVKLDRENVYIVNVLKCRPPDNRNPMPHEIEQCSPYLMRQLEALQPRVICCLGKFAAELLLGSKNATISGMRGKTYRWKGAKLIVTYHPAYCLRSPSAKKPVWDDLQRLAQEYLTD